MSVQARKSWGFYDQGLVIRDWSSADRVWGVEVLRVTLLPDEAQNNSRLSDQGSEDRVRGLGR